MKLNSIAYLAAATASLIGLSGQSAQAGQFYDGWNYAIDSFSDGSGGSVYELKGLAVKKTSDSIFVAITGNMPITGNSSNIGFGDLFFNFSGNSFAEANASSSLLGVRFAGTNESGVSSTGVYQNANAKSVTSTNNGYSSLKQYYDSGFDKVNTQGTDLSTADSVYRYYFGDTVADNPTTSNTGSILNVINSGTKVADITLLTRRELNTAGLKFANFGAAGSKTIGFKFDRTAAFGSDYIANLFLECANDGVALEDVPEPFGIVSFAVVGLMGSALLRRKA